jgi:hypothetical protein
MLFELGAKKPAHSAFRQKASIVPLLARKTKESTCAESRRSGPV